MKLNERSLAFYATCDSPTDKAGFLCKKGERNTAYHRRWFVLKGNMLFYFEDRESREPVGVIILEGCTVELCESTEEFAFAIKFDCARSRTYILAAESQAAMEAWVKSLSRASFDYLRLVVRELEKQLDEMQRSLSGRHRVQRRAPLCRKNKTAPNLDQVALGPGLLQKTVPICIPAKENGCALWNNSPGPVSLPGGNPQESARTCGGGSYEEGLKPPPLPPRRRALSGDAAGAAGGAGPSSPVYPSTACFSKLHDWYGREVLALRRAWLEGAKDSRLRADAAAEQAPLETRSREKRSPAVVSQTQLLESLPGHR
ncbi:Sesquipedalian-1 [Varanus komodoensis]|uniref:sesquipedalian-1 n=1 Tax=Varanus komodoensis TaxID=61221 RepID=UPI001CF7A566|nr:sesquipedalian-1 [Varanus komodoensis]XP_044296757.1 sesquipedalian-1 [Varanus komodoensis]KAF7240840.1 Sesquipedalian-1 [Varanus komodoensis]